MGYYANALVQDQHYSGIYKRVWFNFERNIMHCPSYKDGPCIHCYIGFDMIKELVNCN